MNPSLDCLILAAGNASRFGACKLLANWQGQPLMAATLAAAHALRPETIVVVAGAFYTQLHAQNFFDANTKLLHYRDWQLGMGNSLAFGVQHLGGENAVLILLGDQPLISAQDLQKLYDGWGQNPEKIACASFAGTVGVPAIFPARYKVALATCSGERGAKKLLNVYAHELTAVRMPSAEFDVDTQADLDNLLIKSAASPTLTV